MKKKIKIYAILIALVIVGFVAFLLVWHLREDDFLLRAAIFSTGSYSDNYYYVIDSKGTLIVSTGDRDTDDIRDEPFLDRVKRQREYVLTEDEFSTLISLTEKMYKIEYVSRFLITNDSYNVAVSYKDKHITADIGERYSDELFVKGKINEDLIDLFELIDFIVEISPITVDVFGLGYSWFAEYGH